jgi:hypothetical protein
MGDTWAVAKCILNGMSFAAVNVSYFLVKHCVGWKGYQGDVMMSFQVVVLGAQELGINIRMIVFEFAWDEGELDFQSWLPRCN